MAAGAPWPRCPDFKKPFGNPIANPFGIPLGNDRWVMNR